MPPNSGAGPRWLIRLEALRALAGRALAPPLPDDTRMKPLKTALLRLLRITLREQGDLNRALIDAIELERIEFSTALETVENQLEALQAEVREHSERTAALLQVERRRAAELFESERRRTADLFESERQHLEALLERESERAEQRNTDLLWRFDAARKELFYE